MATDDPLQDLIRLCQAQPQAVNIIQNLQQVLLVVKLADEWGQLTKLMKGCNNAVSRTVATRGGSGEQWWP